MEKHLVAKRRRDSQHISQMTSKSVQHWTQNGSKIGPKMVSEKVIILVSCLSCFWDPIWGPEWTQTPKLFLKWGQLARGAPGAQDGPQNGSMDLKMDPKCCQERPRGAPGAQHGAPKYEPQDGSKMLPRAAPKHNFP